VGVDGFKQHPIGLGPYKFVSLKPGVELVLEAYDGYWRKMPNIKRIVMKGIPEGTTRLAMLKNGEADFASALDGPVAEEVKRDSAKREAILHRIQELSMERVMFAPIFDFRALMGVGPRVAEHTINSIPVYPFPAYEDIKLKAP
jgi:ABC-type transport system substrate-binding protein